MKEEIRERAVQIIKLLGKEDNILLENFHNMLVYLELLRVAIKDKDLNDATKQYKRFEDAHTTVWKKVLEHKDKIKTEDVGIVLKYLQMIGRDAKKQYLNFLTQMTGLRI